MKRWMLIPALVLLLTGCAAPDPTPTDTTATTPPTTTAPTQPAPVSTWTVELDRDYRAMAPMGDGLLLFADNMLALYQDGAVTAMREETLPLPESGAVTVLAESVVYYDAADNALVTLDRKLTETDRISLGETVTGAVTLSADGRQLYYCDATGVRVWDAETRIHRTLKRMEGDWVGVTGSLRDGAYLLCSLKTATGDLRTMAVSSANGETLYEAAELAQISGSGDFYACVTHREWIFGYYGQQPQNLLVEDAIPLPQLQMALTVTDRGRLKLYDLNTGLLIAQDTVEAQGLTCPVPWQNKLAFLAGDQLCVWDYALSPELKPVTDTTVYTAFRYTADAPDYAGLAALRTRAETLEQQYGIDILMWKDVTAAQPAGYLFEVEYRTQAFEAALDTLEKALARFPENFFKKAASWTGDGTLHIVLTRGGTVPENECGTQYLLGWDAYILLDVHNDPEQTFYHGLGHVIDTLVLSNSHGFYEWHAVNPSGFQYDNHFDAWQDRQSKYLEGKDRYFVNSYAMTFPVEDRASLLAYAMMPDNEEVFESKHMQAKLGRLKTGLREAFDLAGEAYPWEQYLNK